MLHFTLSKLPQPLNLESLISQTTALYARYPPDTLPYRAWSRISRFSVLKTTCKPAELPKQTLQEGERLFARQAAQMRRNDILHSIVKDVRARTWKHRRPALLTVAVAVAFLALWLGKDIALSNANGFWAVQGLANGFRKWTLSLLGRR